MIGTAAGEAVRLDPGKPTSEPEVEVACPLMRAVMYGLSNSASHGSSFSGGSVATGDGRAVPPESAPARRTLSWLQHACTTDDTGRA